MKSIDTVHSPDDGGYYSEVYDDKTGVNAFQSDVCESRAAARRAARCWAMREGHNWTRGEDR